VELTNFFEMRIAVASVSKGKLNKTCADYIVLNKKSITEIQVALKELI